jgi:hypothetical protein
MRVIDHRYRSELRQHDLAVRFVSHNARTLSRSYTARVAALMHSRLRGAAPYQVGFFTRSPRIRTEAVILAGYLKLNGTLAEEDILTRAEHLCDAFETYAAVIPNPAITFEHAILLLTALRRGDQLVIRECASCDTLIAVDRIRCPRALCAWCG